MHFKVPQEYQLSNEQCDDFVRSVLPCLEYAAYSKTKSEFCPAIFRILSFISPGQVIPAILDLVYPSLDTIVEVIVEIKTNERKLFCLASSSSSIVEHSDWNLHFFGAR